MSKGGDTTTTSSSSSLPSWYEPYAKDLLAKAKDTTEEPYQAYDGQRLADFSPDTNASFDLIRANARGGSPALDAGIDAATNAANYRSGAIGSTNGVAGNVRAGTLAAPRNVTAGRLGAPTDVRTGTFNFQGIPGANLQPYMDPYVKNVLDVQKQRATQNYQEQQAGRDAGAVAAGAFGGDRRFVADSLAQRDLNQQMQGIDANGLSAAFNNATGLFENDQARRLAAYEGDAGRRLTADTGNADRRMNAGMFDITNRLNTDIGNTERGINAGMFNINNRLSADTGNVNRAYTASAANADRRLQAAGMNEDARRNAASLGISAASTLGQLGQTRQDILSQQAEALSGVGSRVQQRQQAGLDQAYQDFQAQRDYPSQQLSRYSQLLAGSPVQSNTTNTTTGPAPDWLSQLLGAGTSAAGLWQLLSGG